MKKDDIKKNEEINENEDIKESRKLSDEELDQVSAAMIYVHSAGDTRTDKVICKLAGITIWG